MGRALVLTILLMPLVEIGLFIVVGNALGLWPTLAIIVLAGVIGLLTLRWQGFATISRLRASVNGGQLPARSVADAMMIGAAGTLLVLPGFFSDAIGLLLLLPPVRSAIYAWLRSRVRVLAAGAAHSAEFGPPPIEDGTVDLDSDEWRPR